ncbi:MAG: UDP-glucose 6-dehydrogenase [Alphaproteobacteria bacterium]|nr:UDP-glucose/GDP-mannose dehydrogenase family protein [Pelagibacterales bacterium]RUA14616.1 MAG: UDP-glucose 6-dehydrogenase [Alphaproteobacteria bacterium]
MKICIIGTGYVGLVSGACFADLGNSVWCVDNNKEKIDLLNSNQIPFFEPGLEELVSKNFSSSRLKFTTNLKLAVRNSDIIFICVGTPTLKKSRSADLRQVFKVATEVSKYINRFKIIVTKSTVPVTTGDKIEKLILNKKRKKLFEVVSNPEFLREGEAVRDFRFPDRIIVGSNNKKVIKTLQSLYDPLIKKGAEFFSTNRRGAELIKYASNAFLATKISYINELANLCEKTGVNIEDVSLGIGLDKRIGSRFLRAGPAFGGSCFPKDTKAITVTGDLFKTDLSIIKSVIKSNEKRRILLSKRVKKILSNKIKNKKIAFLGVTFKPNTDDMRQSSSLVMIPFLLKKGAKINYYDPSGEKKEFSKLKNLSFYNNVNAACKNVDLVIIHTEWEEFKALDFKKLYRKKKFKIYDMRNLYSVELMKKKGFNYYSIGR